ncbi:translation elongation factor 1-beta, putative [Bodo saltans]|uniref:Translation elongation factor 1-beta, putative n=1 Tax=Bodo saltans TaxID=75058 RepID=A0A0S4JC29_BODSA|nr:translation elongation factor 1-beta, putative [Bodo saltans]|eukprot:CUG89078.1 translation elongation factor 1-beta, putative [Bodo saltans]
MSLKDLNGRLNSQPFLAGYTVSQEDAKTFAELFGSNVNVIQWAARMAAYFQAERDQILTPAAPKAAAAVAAPASSSKPAAADDDDDVDLFGEETEEDKAALEAKKKADAEKKKEKKVVIAKSSILIDIKPWDDTTDLKELAAKLHAIEKDGLIWGDHKFVAIAFGIKKLQQLIVIEDDKVSGDDLEEMITGFEDYVQSMDIVAWNKI